MSAPDLADLIARVEAADGPSRELDAEIAEALGMCQHRRKACSGYQDDTGFDCEDCGADSWGNRSKDGHNRRLYDANPAYTASLDAAMTLVPEGWFLTGGGWIGGESKGFGFGLQNQLLCSSEARAQKRKGMPPTRWTGERYAATPALALCAAALRTRMETTDDR